MFPARFLFFLLLLITLSRADLDFAQPKNKKAPIDSSAQYRSVIMPRIFGGETIEKPLKTVSYLF
jgi:hypothetical protein